MSKRTFPFARCNQQWHLGDLCSPRLLQLAILSFSAQGFHILFLLHSLSNYRLLPEYQHVHLHPHFSLLFPLSPSASLREATHRGAWRTCAAGPLCSRKAIPITPNTTTTQFSSLAKASAPQGCRVRPRREITRHDTHQSAFCVAKCATCQWEQKKKFWSVRSANSTFRKHVLRVNSLQILSDYILNATIKNVCAPVAWVKLTEMIHKEAPRRENNEKPRYYCYDAQKGWTLPLCYFFGTFTLVGGWFERLGGEAISSVCQISTSPPSFYFLYSSQTSAVKAAKCPKSALLKASTCCILRLFATEAAADVLFASECNGRDIWSALDCGNVL